MELSYPALIRALGIAVTMSLGLQHCLPPPGTSYGSCCSCGYSYYGGSAYGSSYYQPYYRPYYQPAYTAAYNYGANYIVAPPAYSAPAVYAPAAYAPAAYAAPAYGVGAPGPTVYVGSVVR